MSEGAKLRNSKQPAPDSDPVLNEGDGEFKDNEVDVRPSELVGKIGDQELDGISKDNIIDDRTRGIEIDYGKPEADADKAVEDASDGANDGTSRVRTGA